MLTERQQRFARAVPIAPSGKAAAEIAGYAPGHGAETEAYRLLRNAEVAPVIAEERAKVEREAVLSKKEWLRKLEALANGENDANAHAQVAALREYGRGCGYTADVVIIPPERLTRVMLLIVRDYVPANLWDEFGERMEQALADPSL